MVDPDETFRTPLADSFRRRGFHVIEVGTEAEALSSIKRTHPAFLVTELRLGEGCGIALVETLVRVCPDARAVLLSDSGTVSHAVAAVRAGVIDYVVKPSCAAVLLDAFLTPAGERIPPPERDLSGAAVRAAQIDRVLAAQGGCITTAAEVLKIDRRTLQRTLRRNGVPPKRISTPRR